MISHLKEDTRQRRERHSNKICHHGTSALTCESRQKDYAFPTDKVKLLDLSKQKPNLGCRPLAELFKETYNIEIGKSKIAKIIKNESNIQREYGSFEGDMKRKKIAKYGIINHVLYEWYIKCCQAGIYPNGVMLQEEVLKIKTEINDSNLGDFKASNGWLEHFKKRFSLRHTRIVGEGFDGATSRNYSRLSY